MPQTNQAHYQTMADQAGIDLSSVKPLSPDQRIEKLAATIALENVPYPIPKPLRQPYLDAARSGTQFSIGEFSGETVDLGQYSNSQNYEQYTFEEHLSWAVLVAEQQKTKHQFACREYLKGEALFEIGSSVIPDYYLLNARIYQQTAWQLATVSEIIPAELFFTCLLYTSPSPRDQRGSRMPSSA